ncbi:MAG TPA: hypothetical protein VEV16_02360 [Daejeonella sp.]|nr:hypothetical protein [Daejeonella sp.]
MKKVTAIAFLSIFLISTTELYQLLKFPLLVEHFIEHKEQNQGLSLGGFLLMHYFNGDVKDADYDKDMQLPFKSHSENAHGNIIASELKKFNIIPKPPYKELKKFIISDETFFTSAFLSCIWQPPKSC